MIWLAIALLAAAALSPLAWTLWRSGRIQGRRDAALPLHRAQLAELDRDLAEARIAPAEHAAARLEIQRRLLTEAAIAEPRASASRAPLVAALIATPIAAVLLYLPQSNPTMPAAPLAARQAEARREAAQSEALAQQLRAKLATLDPRSDQAHQGLILLGNLEDGRGNLPAAAQAWRQALAIRFDPALAAEVAEATTRIEGRVSAATASLFRQALAAAPADAPWRKVAEQRLQE